jgi:hypothetical protein
MGIKYEKEIFEKLYLETLNSVLPDELINPDGDCKETAILIAASDYIQILGELLQEISKKKPT